MDQNKRRWDREPITVPCKISYEGDSRNSAPGSIINLSPGGVMLATEQGFIANERVAITLEDVPVGDFIRNVDTATFIDCLF